MVKFGEFGEVDGEESKEKSISNLSGIHAVISNQVDCWSSSWLKINGLTRFT